MNQEAYDTLWYWINERHRIYQKKEAGLPKPWSEDLIFQHWKFCNVFRQLDTQTRWLKEHVIDPNYLAPAELLFNVFAFRAFNWYQTYSLISASKDGEPWIESWIPERVLDFLYAHVSEGGQLTSGAYMLRGRQGIAKYESIVQTLTEIWNYRHNLLEFIVDESTLQGAHKEIMDAKYWGWGPFTIYQVVLDLTYTPILQNASDINTWCEFGPGAIRGLQEIWPDIKKNEYLDAARDLYVDSFKHLEPHMPNMTLQDIEFSLCELGKYLRIKRGGKGKMKYAGI